jgi:putative ABC transport system permease protein
MIVFEDLRYACRTVARLPVFAGAAIGSLTLGIASATTVFSLVDAALFRPPDFVDAGRLTVITMVQRSPSEGEQRLRWSWARFRQLEEHVRSFDGIGSSSNAVLTITGVDNPEPLPAEIVSSRYLAVMRAPLVLGRGFTPGEDVPERASALVLGFELWQQRFNGSHDVLGRELEVNGVPLTISGVAARGFTGVSGLARAWIPAIAAR